MLPSCYVSCFKRYVAAFFLCVFAFSFFLILANALPVTETMEHNLEVSARLLAQEGDYPSLVNGGYGWTLDNYTTGLMLNTAGHGEDLGILGAFANYHYEPADENNNTQGKSLASSLSKSPSDGGSGWISYARYWHGYLPILKVLLLFTDISGIRVFLYMVISLLILINSVILARVRSPLAGIAFAFPFFVCAYPVVAFSLSFAPCFIISLVICMVVIFKGNKRRRVDLGLLYFFAGSCTAYFDFFCNPLITLGVPLATLVYLQTTSTGISPSIKSNIVLIAKASAIWCCGYGLLWGSKWVLSSYIMQQNVFADAMDQFFVRTGTDSGRLHSILVNCEVCLPYLAIAVCMIGLTLVAFMAFREIGFLKQLKATFVGLALIALLPYCWYFILSNHSTTHYWFTWRTQLITLSCLAYVFVLLLSSLKRVVCQTICQRKTAAVINPKNGKHFKVC